MDGSIEGFRVQAVEVAGRKTRCDTAGPEGAPAVLLLHGFPQTRLAWRRVAPSLAERYQVVCPDLPGYGESEMLEDGPAGFRKTPAGCAYRRVDGLAGTPAVRGGRS